MLAHAVMGSISQAMVASVKVHVDCINTIMKIVINASDIAVMVLTFRHLGEHVLGDAHLDRWCHSILTNACTIARRVNTYHVEVVIV